MEDSTFFIRTIVSLIGLAIAVSLTIVALLVNSVPWWLFFLAVAVLPITEPVGKFIDNRVTKDDSNMKFD